MVFLLVLYTVMDFGQLGIVETLKCANEIAGYPAIALEFHALTDQNFILPFGDQILEQASFQQRFLSSQGRFVVHLLGCVYTSFMI